MSDSRGGADSRRMRLQDQESVFYEKRREQREKLASKGAAEMWALSPTRPDLE